MQDDSEARQVLETKASQESGEYTKQLALLLQRREQLRQVSPTTEGGHPLLSLVSFSVELNNLLPFVHQIHKMKVLSRTSSNSLQLYHTQNQPTVTTSQSGSRPSNRLRWWSFHTISEISRRCLSGQRTWRVLCSTVSWTSISIAYRAEDLGCS
jgi:hypothetical protein